MTVSSNYFLSILGAFCLLFVTNRLNAQTLPTLADTLRGALRSERLCFDVTHYDLDIELFPEKKTISGVVTMKYIGRLQSDTIQIDLARTMRLSNIEQNGKALGFRRVEDAIFIGLNEPTCFGESGTLIITYNGAPEAALNPPWDGGFTWTTDSLNRTWAGVSCEGIGASIWWPNKDHLSDEPDSVSISLTVPDPLRAIANGQFKGVDLRPDPPSPKQ